MPNLDQAPKLVFDIPKDKGNQYYELPQKLMDIIFAELGNSSAQLRIMIVLIGTKPDFGVSEKWICDRTGLLPASYKTARKQLVKRGWLTHEDGKIIVNFKNIYASGNMVYPHQNENRGNMTYPLDENKNENRGNMVYPQRGNVIYPQGGNMVYPIIDNEQINKQISNDEIPAVGSDKDNPIVKEVYWFVDNANEIIKVPNVTDTYQYKGQFYKVKR